MGIRIAHEPVATPIIASYATGVGRAQQREKQRSMDTLKYLDQKMMDTQKFWLNRGFELEDQATRFKNQQTLQEGRMQGYKDRDAARAARDRIAAQVAGLKPVPRHAPPILRKSLEGTRDAINKLYGDPKFDPINVPEHADKLESLLEEYNRQLDALGPPNEDANLRWLLPDGRLSRTPVEDGQPVRIRPGDDGVDAIEEMPETQQQKKEKEKQKKDEAAAKARNDWIDDEVGNIKTELENDQLNAPDFKDETGKGFSEQKIREEAWRRYQEKVRQEQMQDSAHQPSRPDEPAIPPSQLPGGQQPMGSLDSLVNGLDLSIGPNTPSTQLPGLGAPGHEPPPNVDADQGEKPELDESGMPVDKAGTVVNPNMGKNAQARENRKAERAAKATRAADSKIEKKMANAKTQEDWMDLFKKLSPEGQQRVRMYAEANPGIADMSAMGF